MLEINGYSTQFWNAQTVGHAEVIFSPKSALLTIIEKDIGFHILLIDLEKANDSVHHDVTSLVVKKMGDPQRHFKQFEKSHGEFDTILKGDSYEVSTRHGRGVRMRSVLVPTLLPM